MLFMASGSSKVKSTRRKPCHNPFKQWYLHHNSVFMLYEKVSGNPPESLCSENPVLDDFL